jgi:two-component system, NtrC family, response regulator HydG
VKGRVLVVDDDPSMCDVLVSDLGEHGFEVTARTSAASALEALAPGAFDAVVTDLNMPGMDGLELCRGVAGAQPDVPVIVITAFGSIQTAVAAIRGGAYDFVTKPLDVEALALALDRAVQNKTLRDEVKRLRRAVDESRRFGALLGTSPAMRRVYDLLDRIVDSNATVLVTGETGTGKELVARALHERGRRRTGPFVAVNCAALPEALLESELFGHVRGAFTDAHASRKGLFVQAIGGTLFLDEIGEMPLALQAKLLRALQARKVRPVGSNDEVAFDVRLIAATNRDLDSAVEEERFREDLYFRINVIQVEMPSLRMRGGDILLLAQHFVERYAAQAEKRVVGLAPEAAERLLAYVWPGNVRELENCIERAIALARGETIGPEDLPEKVRAFRHSHVLVGSDDPAELPRLEEVERRYILRVMEAVGGNKTLAARVLGVGRKTLYRKLEQYGGGGGP